MYKKKIFILLLTSQRVYQRFALIGWKWELCPKKCPALTTQGSLSPSRGSQLNLRRKTKNEDRNVLCISTSERVLRRPFAGQNRLSDAKTTFSVTNGTLKLANLYQLLKRKLENMSQHYLYNFKLTRIIHYKSIKLLKNRVK